MMALSVVVLMVMVAVVLRAVARGASVSSRAATLRRASWAHHASHARMFVVEFSMVEVRSPVIVAKRALGMEFHEAAVVVELADAIVIHCRV